MKRKIINFYPEAEAYKDIFDEPVLSKSLIPEWYKNQDKYASGIKVISDKTGQFNTTIKACMPVFDVMTAGYIITTPADIHVAMNDDGLPSFSWSINNYTCIESHALTQYDKYNTPKEFYEIGYKFINPWLIQTPKGYSSLFVSPFFRDDLPFQCLPAIVDTDNHPIAVNFPFFMRKDFEGVIPMGTPIIQIIPFKRDSWDHKVNAYDPNFRKIWNKAERKIGNRYKTFFRVLKDWN